MKKVVLSAVAVLAVSAVPAFAADMPTKAPAAVVAPAPTSPFDIAFGGAIMSDYNFRGISQSNRKPSVAAYVEPRYNINPNLQLYAGLAGESISFPNKSAAEIDFYAGVRPTFGPLSFDFGFWYYYYPTGTAVPGIIKADLSFWEVYGKTAYTFMDVVTLGGNFYYSPSWLNSGATGTYASGTAKIAAPSGFFGNKDIGGYASGEFGRYWLGTTDSFYGSIKLASYNTWNLGAGLTWKAFTLDVRYYDTNLTKTQCFLDTGDLAGLTNGGQSNWCNSTVIVKLSFDTTANALK
jgi:uncharacterized protein (TIGR02001 family)